MNSLRDSPGSFRALSLSCALALSLLGGGARAVEGWETLDAIPNPQPAPDFALPDLAGKVHRLSDYRGKTVLVNFWATWCDLCREEMPSLQRAAEKLRDQGLVVLAVDVGEEEGYVLRFSKDYQVHLPLLLDKESALMQQWEMKGLPTTFVVDRSCRVAYKAQGAIEWDHPGMLDKLQALLKVR